MLAKCSCAGVLRRVGIFFRNRLLGARSLADAVPGGWRRRIYRRSRYTRRKRTLGLALLFSCLFSVVLAERGLLALNRADTAKNPLSLLSDRSPGGRGEGPLLLTKSKPHERVLASMRKRDPKGGAGPALAGNANAADPGGLFTPQSLGAPASGPYYPVPYSYYFPPSLPGTRTPTDPPPTVSVPEPATWALMIFGLFFVVASLRQDGREREIG